MALINAGDGGTLPPPPEDEEDSTKPPQVENIGTTTKPPQVENIGTTTEALAGLGLPEDQSAAQIAAILAAIEEQKRLGAGETKPIAPFTFEDMEASLTKDKLLPYAEQHLDQFIIDSIFQVTGRKPTSKEYDEMKKWLAKYIDPVTGTAMPLTVETIMYGQASEGGQGGIYGHALTHFGALYSGFTIDFSSYKGYETLFEMGSIPRTGLDAYIKEGIVAGDIEGGLSLSDGGIILTGSEFNLLNLKDGDGNPILLPPDYSIVYGQKEGSRIGSILGVVDSNGWMYTKEGTYVSPTGRIFTPEEYVSYMENVQDTQNLLIYDMLNQGKGGEVTPLQEYLGGMTSGDYWERFTYNPGSILDYMPEGTGMTPTEFAAAVYDIIIGPLPQEEKIALLKELGLQDEDIGSILTDIKKVDDDYKEFVEGIVNLGRKEAEPFLTQVLGMDRTDILALYGTKVPSVVWWPERMDNGYIEEHFLKDAWDALKVSVYACAYSASDYFDALESIFGGAGSTLLGDPVTGDAMMVNSNDPYALLVAFDKELYPELYKKREESWAERAERLYAEHPELIPHPDASLSVILPNGAPNSVSLTVPGMGSLTLNKDAFTPRFFTQAAATQVPIIATFMGATTATAVVTGGAGLIPILGGGILSAPIMYDESYSQFKQYGMDDGQAKVWAVIAANVKSMLESACNVAMLRTISPTMGGAIGGFFNKIEAHIAKGAIIKGMFAGGSILVSEGFEEVLQQGIDNAIVDTLTEYDVAVFENWKETVAQTMIASAGFAFLGGGSTVVRTTLENATVEMEALQKHQMEQAEKAYVEGFLQRDVNKLYSGLTLETVVGAEIFNDIMAGRTAQELEAAGWTFDAGMGVYVKRFSALTEYHRQFALAKEAGYADAQAHFIATSHMINTYPEVEAKVQEEFDVFLMEEARTESFKEQFIKNVEVPSFNEIGIPITENMNPQERAKVVQEAAPDVWGKLAAVLAYASVVQTAQREIFRVENASKFESIRSITEYMEKRMLAQEGRKLTADEKHIISREGLKGKYTRLNLDESPFRFTTFEAEQIKEAIRDQNNPWTYSIHSKTEVATSSKDVRQEQMHHAYDAFQGILNGVAPRKFEIRDLMLFLRHYMKDAPNQEKVQAHLDAMEKNFIELAEEERSGIRAYIERYYNIINAWRTLRSSTDMSAVGRQGWYLLLRSPRVTVKAFRLMVAAQWGGLLTDIRNMERTMSAEDRYLLVETINETLLEACPDKMRDAVKKYITLTSPAGDFQVREEAVMSNTFDNWGMGVGNVLTRSRTGYSVFLNSLRIMTAIDMFTKMGETNAKLQKEVEDALSDLRRKRITKEQYYAKKAEILKDSFTETHYEEVGAFIDMLTGRGPLGPLKEAAPVLTAFLFAPRFRSARILTPVKMAQYAMPTSRFNVFMSRQLVIPALAMLGATTIAAWGLVYILSMFMPVGFSTDPEDPDFMKIVIGDYHIDITGGNASTWKYMWNMARHGVYAVSEVARTIPIIGDYVPEVGQPTRKNIFGTEMPVSWSRDTARYLQSSLSPLASVVSDVWTGETFLGEPLDFGDAEGTREYFLDNVPPLSMWQIITGIREGGLTAEAVAIAPFTFLGFATQYYDARASFTDMESKVGEMVPPLTGEYDKDWKYYTTSNLWSDWSSWYKFGDLSLEEVEGAEHLTPLMRFFLESRDALNRVHDEVLTKNPYANNPLNTYNKPGEGPLSYVDAYTDGVISEQDYKTLEMYYALKTDEDRADFLDEHPLFAEKFSKRMQDYVVEYSSADPVFGAMMAYWGKAKITTREAQAEFEKLLDMYPQLDTGFEAGYFVPTEYADDYFDYQDVLSRLRDENGGTLPTTSWEERYFLYGKSDEFAEFLGKTPYGGLSTDYQIDRLEFYASNGDAVRKYREFMESSAYKGIKADDEKRDALVQFLEKEGLFEVHFYESKSADIIKKLALGTFDRMDDGTKAMVEAYAKIWAESVKYGSYHADEVKLTISSSKELMDALQWANTYDLLTVYEPKDILPPAYYELSIDVRTEMEAYKNLEPSPAQKELGYTKSDIQKMYLQNNDYFARKYYILDGYSKMAQEYAEYYVEYKMLNRWDKQGWVDEFATGRLEAYYEAYPEKPSYFDEWWYIQDPEHYRYFQYLVKNDMITDIDWRAVPSKEEMEALAHLFSLPEGDARKDYISKNPIVYGVYWRIHRSGFTRQDYIAWSEAFFRDTKKHGII